MVREVEYEDGSSRVEALSRRERGRKLMDQKANSVADMAVVLGGEGGEDGGEREGGVVVEVRWKDLLDAEFAETWPSTVVHDSLDGGSAGSAYGGLVQDGEAPGASTEAPVAPVEASKLERVIV